jgi:ASC-1-like (ASCH) protein
MDTEKKLFYDYFIKQYQILDNMYKNLEFDLIMYENEKNEEKSKIVKDKYDKLKDIKWEFIKLHSTIIAEYYR